MTDVRYGIKCVTYRLFAIFFQEKKRKLKTPLSLSSFDHSTSTPSPSHSLSQKQNPTANFFHYFAQLNNEDNGG